ncbi:hypothetical protein O181_084533 [Austropuccinia psidii MF-1]|uniref:Uncharacterized protein n=1 Tax=Austropuccinia psidii MF-1 TaxID=1389203 RepID=A0A9Q3FRH9_9BASI|nr:hypothetical protein [Austropuccinia psidii MF-1]
MTENTPIIQHFQDFLTGKVPFDQIPKIQGDDQYYENPPECKSICGRPQGAKNKNKREPSIFEIIESQSKRRGRPLSKVTRTKHQDHSHLHPLQSRKWINLNILRPHYQNQQFNQIHYPPKLN